jgi:hypothetical protein
MHSFLEIGWCLISIQYARCFMAELQNFCLSNLVEKSKALWCREKKIYQCLSKVTSPEMDIFWMSYYTHCEHRIFKSLKFTILRTYFFASYAPLPNLKKSQGHRQPSQGVSCLKSLLLKLWRGLLLKGFEKILSNEIDESKITFNYKTAKPSAHI